VGELIALPQTPKLVYGMGPPGEGEEGGREREEWVGGIRTPPPGTGKEGGMEGMMG